MKELVVITSKKNLLLPFFLVLAILSIIAALFFFIHYQKAQATLNNPDVLGASEVKELAGRVGALIELPSDEDPTVATVSDKSKLLDQPFFKNSENGDKVLIYSKAKKAILYRPSENKIIEVSSVNTGDVQKEGAVSGVSTTASPTPIASPNAPQTLSAVILNGTLEAGLAGRTKTTLEQRFTNVKVSKTGDSVGDYTKTLVVDLSGKNSAVAKQIADALGGEVGDLPSEESRPSNTDLLVIVVQ